MNSTDISDLSGNSLTGPDINSTDGINTDGLRIGFYTTYDDYAVGTAYMTTAVLGFVLNFLTIIIVTRGKKTSREVKIQLTNLAMADMLSAAFLPAYSMISVLMLSFPQSVPLCKFIRFMGFGAFYVSPLWNVAISMERFVVVYFPLKVCNYTQKHKMLVACFVWILGFLPEIESLLFSRVDFLYGTWICYTFPPMLEHNRVGYEWVLTVKYCLPALIITVCYTLIGIKLCTKSRIGERGSVKQETNAARQKTQVLRMLAMDACITLITWLPFNLLYSISGGADTLVQHTRREIFILDSVLLGLMLTNVFTSPIIYFIFNRAFREDAAALFYCRPTDKQRVSVTTSGGSNNNGHTLITKLRSTISRDSRESQRSSSDSGYKESGGGNSAYHTTDMADCDVKC